MDLSTLRFNKIGHRVTAGVGAVFAVAIIAMVMFYAKEQERSILTQNEHAIHKVTQSVINGMQTVMLAGYADIAQAFAENLKTVPDVDDFRILRANGLEAFKDNSTIDFVNDFRGEEDFFPREEEKEIAVLPPDHEYLQDVIEDQEIHKYYNKDENGVEYLTFLAPIINNAKCHKCHGSDHKVRGVLKLTTSLEPIKNEIKSTRQKSFIVLAISLTCITLITYWMIRRTIVNPISQVTSAMQIASTGELNQRVPVFGRDELSTMANSFNKMISELLHTHTGLFRERNKLKTIILSAREGIIVTDGEGQIVLVNPSAETILEKTEDDIISQGFMQILDDESLMELWLEKSEEHTEAFQHEYKSRILSINVATIRDSKTNSIIGRSSLIRDITDQMNLEKKLRMLSDTDGLTGLFNRRFLDKTIDAELTRAKRYSLELSILMFDVDHFKSFNDTYGHDHGDRVLQTIAKLMKKNCRNIDFPCRYGGEEFIMILPSTDVDGAVMVAERLRQEIETTAVEGVQVTISIGICNYPTHKVEKGETMVTTADGALYEAKEGGRNQVVVATVDDV